RRPRSTSPGSGSSTSPTWTRPWSGPSAPRPRSCGRSRSARSSKGTSTTRYGSTRPARRERSPGSLAVTAEAVFRHEYGRCVAALIRFLGDIDAAEEAVQDAFTVAVARWPADGQPPNPGAWIVATARNRAIDRLRRESVRDERHEQAHHLYGAAAQADQDNALAREEETVRDDRLRLIFTCCHPALNQPAQVALTPRLLGGLGTPEIARAFLVPEATMAQRIVRAKRKI